MDLRVLEYFLAVAEVGGISRAADILHISQPTLSRQLMELEREIGSTLLIRGKRSVTLTPDGLMFRETARDILALYQKAQEKHAQSTELSGDIHDGTHDGILFVGSDGQGHQEAAGGSRFLPDHLLDTVRIPFYEPGGIGT